MGTDLAALTLRPSRHMQILHSCVGGGVCDNASSPLTRMRPAHPGMRRGVCANAALLLRPGRPKGFYAPCPQIPQSKSLESRVGKSLIGVRDLPTTRNVDSHLMVPGRLSGIT